MKLTVLIIMTLFLTFEGSATELVYEAEGRFSMGDTDTKQEAQIQARQQAKINALEEAGIYVESIVNSIATERKGKVEEEFTRDIKTITAGVVRVRDEDVSYRSEFDSASGNAIWFCKLKARIDENDVKNQINKLLDNRKLLAGFGEAQQENQRQLQELVRLREENEKLHRLVLERGQNAREPEKQEYQAEMSVIEKKKQDSVRRLEAVSSFEKGLNAQKEGKTKNADHY